jgi:quercetin dioxygenase-like cupin family protein
MSTRTLVAVLLPTLAFSAAPSAPAPADHGIFAPTAIGWQAGPPSLPEGAKFAVLEGDPTKEGLFTMRLRMPDGYRIPPHWHPAVEHVTVVSGTFHVGMGDRFEADKAGGLPTGTFAFLAPQMHHFAWAEGETVIQLHGTGPWQINYLDPANDPRRK